MVTGTDLKSNSSLIVTDSVNQFIKSINENYFKDFDEQRNKERIAQASVFDNQLNVNKLLKEVFV